MSYRTEEAIQIVCAVASLVALVIVGYLFGAWPGRIAQGRGHPSADAIRICGVLGLLFWPMWLVAIVWAYTGQHTPPQPVRRYPTDADAPPAAVPEHPAVDARSSQDTADAFRRYRMSKPGRFRVVSVDRQTGVQSSILLAADSGAHARAKAEINGLVVTSIEPEVA